MIFFLRFLIIMLCLLTQKNFAEIINVTITYNKGLCDAKCSLLVAKTFQRMDPVSNVNVGPGQILLSWKPEKSFSYQLVKRPMQMVGLAIDGIFVTVRGQVAVRGQKAVIRSLGDNTQFELTSAPAPKGGQYVQYNNPISYTLLPALRNQLKEAEKSRQIVTVSGFLLMPHRMPLTIVVGNINVQKKHKQ